jgi:hypothetical protein
MVEAWISWTGHQDSIRKESDILKKELRKCRRQMQKARRWKPHNITDIEEAIADTPAASSRGATLVNEEIDELDEGDEKDEDHAECSIIDLYANRLSFLPGDDHIEAIHPVSENSEVFWPPSGPFQRTVPVPAEPQRQSATYSEGVYDVQESRTSFPRYGIQRASANQYAESYRMLMEMGEVEEVKEQWDGRRTRRECRTQMAR